METESQASDVVECSRNAFLAELPALLENPKHDGWCVAYCGSERIALARDHVEVIRDCADRGLRADAYFIISSRWYEEEEIDTGFYEFEDIENGD